MQRGITKSNRLEANSSPIAELSVKAVSLKRNKMEPNITSYFNEYEDFDYNIEAFVRIAYKTGKYDGRSARHLKFDKCGNCEEKDAQLMWYYEDDCYYDCHACYTQVCKTCMVGIPEDYYHKHFNNNFIYPGYDKTVWGTEKDSQRMVCGTCYQDHKFRLDRKMNK